MTKRKQLIRLTLKERERLLSIVTKGTCAARAIRRAQVLLELDGSVKTPLGNYALSKVLHVFRNTINNIVKGYLLQGIACIYRKKRSTPSEAGKITGEVETHLTALAFHNPPEGYCKCSLRLLADTMVIMYSDRTIDVEQHTYDDYWQDAK